MMARSKINVREEFSAEIIEVRQSLATRLEKLAADASAYRSHTVGAWQGTLPVVAAAMLDVMHVGADSENEASPSLQGALDRSKVTEDHLTSHDPDTVRLAISKAKGAALEIDVQGAFQGGILRAPVGTDSVEQLSFTNPGADFAFHDSHGKVLALMNTKASDSYEIIAKHFVKYPDVNYVYATHEAAVDAAKHGMQVIDGVHGTVPLVHDHVVVDTGFLDREYEEAIGQMGLFHEHGIDAFLHGEGIIDNIPWITLGLLAFRAYKRHGSGMTSPENIAKSIRDVGRSGAAYGAATLLQHAGVPVPITIASSMFTSATVQGIYKVKDQWQFLSQYDEMLATRVEATI